MLLASWQIQEYFVIEIDFQSGKKQKIFVEKRRVSLGEFWLFVIGFEGNLDENLEENLQELCVEENCLFVQIETINYSLQPLSFSKGENSSEDLDDEENWNFQIWKYYKKFIPPYTAVIDLTKSEEEILTAMKPKGRYNIRLAEKKWVEVREVVKSDENIKLFHTLMQETTSRDNFFGNTLEYYQEFLKQEMSHLFFAYHEDEVIAAGIFISHHKVMYYYYGASSSKKRNLMAPYLLQWKAIEKAKKLGCILYDFLGIAGPDEKNSPLIGVTDFKLKLTADKCEVSQSYIYIYKVWKYRLIQFLKHFKK